MDYIPRNREKVRKSRKVAYWCFSCDMGLVQPGGRCSYCKKKDYQRREKKAY